MSRGAAFALMVDDGAEARALIRQNVEALGLAAATRIFRRDATKLGTAHPLAPFSLVFLDPPYGRGLAVPALTAARAGGWLTPAALVVVEEAADAPLPPALKRRFAQRFVDAGVALGVHTLDRVAHGLHEAIDQRGLDVGARRAHDAARADGALVQVIQELLFPLGPGFGFFHRGQGTRHAAVQVFQAGFAGLEVLLGQHVLADGLGGGQVLRAQAGVSFHGCLQSWVAADRR